MHSEQCCVRGVALTADLDAYISAPRLKTYLDAAANDLVLARALYVWNRDLSAAFIGDIAIVEIAMRNAMSAALSQRWGDRWYADGPLLDARSAKQLEEAWDRIPKAQRQNLRANRAVAGRLVANCMFGFWVNLLDKGGSTGLPAPRDVADHDVLWEEALKKAFKGARAEAHAVGAGLERLWVHNQVKVVNDLRNRVAHHESLVNGYPLTGQGGVRRTAAEGHEACLRLVSCAVNSFH
jgi:hypothetical protein